MATSFCRLTQKPQRSHAIPPLRNARLQNLALVVNLAPAIVGFAIYTDESLIQMPAPLHPGRYLCGTLLPDLATANIGPNRSHQALTLPAAALAEQLGVLPAYINHDALTLIGVFTLRCRRVEARLVLGDTSSGVGGTLFKNIALGSSWFEEIKAGMTMQAIADREGMTQRRVVHLVDLAFLAPDIIQATVDGRQPATPTADSLIKSWHRIVWAAQRAWLATI